MIDDKMRAALRHAIASGPIGPEFVRLLVAMVAGVITDDECRRRTLNETWADSEPPALRARIDAAYAEWLEGERPKGTGHSAADARVLEGMGRSGEGRPGSYIGGDVAIPSLVE